MISRRWWYLLPLPAVGLAAATLPPLASDGSALPAAAPLMIAPFLLLLLSIAVLPLIDREWWDTRYPIVAIGLGLFTVFYYLVILRNPGGMEEIGMDYLSFIVLIGSLFVVAGGIHIPPTQGATPLANTLMLAAGALASNLLGTTGASMILIRPYLRSNRRRLRPYHTVFFIFLVSNIGGSLSPIGDPPLFLGYLRGVPFFWVTGQLWPAWLAGVGGLALLFYWIDSKEFRKAHLQKPGPEAGPQEGWGGLHNVFFLAVIVLAAFAEHPKFLREMIMLLAAGLSYVTTQREIHEKNGFTFAPVKEVAILFFGIFATMVPALEWLEANAGQIGLATPGHFYWGTGTLSSLLDNAPTYMNFLSAAIGLFSDQTLATPGARIAHLIAHQGVYLKAISVGAVFFGAMTYIGNGPNFMVKSVAESEGAPVPSFAGYIARYSAPILIPLFVVLWLVFFRG